MARYGVDYESVREAAERLRDAGETVTVERLRATLGTGSFTTLGRHLRTWRHLQAPSEHTAAAMPQMINDAAQTVWNNLTRAAEERVVQAELGAQSAIAQAEDALEKERAGMLAQLREAEQRHKAALTHMQQRHADLEVERDRWLTRSKEAQEACSASQADHQAAQATIEALQQRCEAQQTLLGQVDTLRSDVAAQVQGLQAGLAEAAQQGERERDERAHAFEALQQETARHQEGLHIQAQQLAELLQATAAQRQAMALMGRALTAQSDALETLRAERTQADVAQSELWQRASAHMDDVLPQLAERLGRAYSAQQDQLIEEMRTFWNEASARQTRTLMETWESAARRHLIQQPPS